MGKRQVPLKQACRQTRLDTFFKPDTKRARVETTRPQPASPPPAVPSAAAAAASWEAYRTTILSSTAPSPAMSVHSTPTPVDSPVAHSLTNSPRLSAGTSPMRRSASHSSVSGSSTASYYSTTSATLASSKKRTTSPGKGTRTSTPAAPPKVKTYFHDYNELLTPPSPVPSPTTITGQHASTARWGELSVILPWASRNTVRGDNGRATHAWPLLLQILQEGVARNVNDLCELMQALLIHTREPQWSSFATFRALCTVVDSLLSPQERQEFFDDVLPYMRRTVMKGPRCFHAKRVAVLRQNSNKRVLLTGEEAFTLMCCHFFSLFPGRSASTLFDTATRRRFGVSPKLPAANFDCLFSLPMRNPERWEAALNKIRCLLQYFFEASRARRVKDPRCLEICRVSYARFPDFAKSKSHLQPLELRRQGLIEEDHTALQVDFANRIIGGGVLGQGCVQEEIRFVVSPELMLSRLIAEPLLDHESVVVTGARQYSYYKGYADTFRYAEANAAEKANATTITNIRSPVRDRQGNRLPMPNISVVAMDAVDFHAVSKLPGDQYLPTWIDRECMKAFVAFYGAPRDFTAAHKARRGAIATGNWGCGAFGGDVQLKLLIQWCAASEAGRSIHYYVFDRVDLEESFAPVYTKLVNEMWTVGDVFRALRSYKPPAAASAPEPSLTGGLAGFWEELAPAGPDLFTYILETNLSELRGN